MSGYPEWRQMWDESGPWRPTVDDITTLFDHIDALSSVVRHLIGSDTPPDESHTWRNTNTDVTPAEAAAIRAALEQEADR